MYLKKEKGLFFFFAIFQVKPVPAND